MTCTKRDSSWNLLLGQQHFKPFIVSADAHVWHPNYLLQHTLRKALIRSVCCKTVLSRNDPLPIQHLGEMTEYENKATIRGKGKVCKKKTLKIVKCKIFSDSSYELRVSAMDVQMDFSFVHFCFYPENIFFPKRVSSNINTSSIKIIFSSEV